MQVAQTDRNVFIQPIVPQRLRIEVLLGRHPEFDAPNEPVWNGIVVFYSLLVFSVTAAIAAALFR